MSTATRLDHPRARLSSSELLASWRALELGEPPSLPRLPAYLHSHQRGAARRAQQAALDSLARRGICDGTRPTGALARMLRTLASADYLLDLHTHHSGDPHPRLGLGALTRTHHDGVVVLSQDDTFWLYSLDALHVAPTLLELAGELPAGQGCGVNLPAEVFAAAARATTSDSVWELADQLRRQGIPSAETSALARMLTGATTGGQLGATAHHAGLTRRGPWTINYHRTPTGTYLRLCRDGTLTVTPTDTPRLLTHWHTLINHLPPPPR